MKVQVAIEKATKALWAGEPNLLETSSILLKNFRNKKKMKKELKS